MMLPIYATPRLSVGAGRCGGGRRRLSSGGRRAAIVAAILLACGVFTLLRTGGISGGGDFRLALAVDSSPEERLLARAARRTVRRLLRLCRRHQPPRWRRLHAEPLTRPADAPASRFRLQPPAEDFSPGFSSDQSRYGDWPGFRGPRSRRRRPRCRIETDWSESPPVAAVAPADRTGLVVLRGPRRHLLHPGTARRRRDRRLLQRRPPASQCGATATRSGSGSRTAAPVRARHRPSATVASAHLVRPES